MDVNDLQALMQLRQGGGPGPIAGNAGPAGTGHLGGPGAPTPGAPPGVAGPPQGGGGEGGIMEYIRKMMEARKKQQMLQMLAQQGGAGLQGPSGGLAPQPGPSAPQPAFSAPPPSFMPQQDPEEQAMRQYLQKAMMEAQAPLPQGGPQGSAAVAPVGAGRSTLGQVRNRGADLDEMIRRAGG